MNLRRIVARFLGTWYSKGHPMKQEQLNLYGVDHHRRLFTSNSVKRDILQYLGDQPRAMLVYGPEHSPDLCINLGKLLVWIAHNFDDHHGPNFSASVELDETAASVKALGEQFSHVGRKLLAGGPGRLEARVVFLQDCIESLRAQLCEMFGPQCSPPQFITVPDWLRENRSKTTHADRLAQYRAIGGVE